MAYDFPSSPTVGQIWTDSSGASYVWHDGVWNASTNPGNGYAPINSPLFTGDPRAPTPAFADDDDSIATTAYVRMVMNTASGPQGPEGPEGPEGDAGPIGPQGTPGFPGGVIVSDTTPAGSLEDGLLWWNSANGNLYAWYEDIDSSQWVQINTASSNDGPTSVVGQRLWAENIEANVNTDYSITDLKAAKYNRLFSAVHDDVRLVSYMDNATVDAYRAGSNPDITAALIAADAALSTNGVLNILPRAGIISGTVIKKQGTNWRCIGSTLGSTWTGTYNGPLIRVNGNHTSTDGSIIGLRLVSNRTTYPLGEAIHLDEVFTMRLEHLRIGGFNYGIYAHNCLALYCQNLYIFDCVTDGMRVEGDPADPETPGMSGDNRFFDCQFTGDRYGLALVHAKTARLNGCRPQGSGIANLFADHADYLIMEGGFCDSATIHASGGGNGVRIVNTQGATINGVTFYANGDTDPHIFLFVDGAGETTESIIISNCQFAKGWTHTSVEAIQFNTPLNGGAYHNIIISGNSFGVGNLAVSTVIGLNNISSGLRLSANVGQDALITPVQSVTATSGTFEIDAKTEIVRCTTPLTGALDLVLTGKGNTFGKVVRVIRTSTATGAFNINVRSCDGTTLVRALTAASTEVTAYCSTASMTPTSAVYTAVS